MGERALDWLAAEYERGLRWVLQHQGLVLTITVLTFVLNVYLFMLVPKGFFPQQDTGRIGGQIRGQQDVSFRRDEAEGRGSWRRSFRQDPGVQNVMAFVGGGGPGGGGSNSGNMFIFAEAGCGAAEDGRYGAR